MKIALDYDGTFNKAKGFWTDFIIRAEEDGHTVYIVTHRHPEIDAHDDFRELKAWVGTETFFTDGMAKQEYMREKGIEIDWWIDDRPIGIVRNSDWLPDSEELAEWRRNGRP